MTGSWKSAAPRQWTPAQPTRQTAYTGPGATVLNMTLSQIDDNSDQLLATQSVSGKMESFTRPTFQRERSNGMSHRIKLKEIDQDYAHEMKDPSHRFGKLLDDLLKKSPYREQGFCSEFYSWCDSLSDSAVLDMFGSDVILRRFKAGVKYLNETNRSDYMIEVENGQLYWRGPPGGDDMAQGSGRTSQGGASLFNTARFHTVASGVGYAIFVMAPPTGQSRRMRFYSAAHDEGFFHHSSFTGGSSIVAGGEWKVEDGQIKVINGKTGHYKTDIEALKVMVAELRAQQVPLGGAQVEVYNTADRKCVLVPATEFVGWGPAQLAQHDANVNAGAKIRRAIKRFNLLGMDMDAGTDLGYD